MPLSPAWRMRPPSAPLASVPEEEDTEAEQILDLPPPKQILRDFVTVPSQPLEEKVDTVARYDDEAACCGVCLEPLASDTCTLRPCNHTFCAECIKRLLDWKLSKCPMCRAVPVGLHGSDRKEEDKMAAATVLLSPSRERGRLVGITFSNTTFRGRHAVCVVRTRPNALACGGGLRRGDVVLSINGLPTVCHEQAVAIVEAATDRGEPMSLSTTAPTHRRAWGRRPCRVASET